MSQVHWSDRLPRGEQKWLVTGAAGFIGSHLVHALLEAGQQVVGFDDFSTGHRSNLEAVEALVGEEAWHRFHVIEADVRDFKACLDSVRGVDYVLHEAALGSVPRSMEDPLTAHEVNVDGTVNVFLAALRVGVRKVVYASSSSVYGDDPRLPKTEDRTGKPLSPYAVTKQVGELYAATLERTHGLPAVGLRYFNVVGPRQDADGPYAAVGPRWIAAMRAGSRPIIYGDGETTRDFCPVGNVVQANLLAAVSGNAANGRVYNIALGGRTTLDELFLTLRDALVANGVDCSDIEAVYEDFRPGDIRHSLADISRARADLGYAPDITLEEGLRLTVDGWLGS